MTGVLNAMVGGGVPYTPAITNRTVSITASASALVSIIFNGNDTTQANRGEMSTLTTANGNTVQTPRDPEWAGTIGNGAADPGSYFEIRLTVSSGASPTSGSSVGSWLSLTTGRSWGLTRTSGSGAGTSTGNWLVEIRKNNGHVVASATYTMNATIS